MRLGGMLVENERRAENKPAHNTTPAPALDIALGQG